MANGADSKQRPLKAGMGVAAGTPHYQILAWLSTPVDETALCC